MKAKTVLVRFELIKVTRYKAVYQCPNCHVEFEDYDLGKRVLRFRCDCGQEIIVKEC